MGLRTARPKESRACNVRSSRPTKSNHYARQLIAVLGNVGADEAHVPAIRIVAIDSDNGAGPVVKRTIRSWHVDGEAIYTVAAISLNVHFKNPDRVTACT